MGKLSKDPKEWLKQAESDIKTANHVAKDKQSFYALFFCHLAVEKALKGLYFKRLGVVPPKTHNLLYLLEKVEEQPTKDVYKFFLKMNEVHIVTRYPEDIGKIQRMFSSDYISFALEKSKETIEWIKSKF